MPHEEDPVTAELVSIASMLEEAKKAQPDLGADVFTVLVQACLQTGDIGHAWEVFRQMRDYGAAPDAKLLTTMVNICARSYVHWLFVCLCVYRCDCVLRGAAAVVVVVVVKKGCSYNTVLCWQDLHF